jgi:hypothetical protein
MDRRCIWVNADVSLDQRTKLVELTRELLE